MADLNRRLKDQELSLRLTDTAKDYIIEGGYDPVYGARPLKRYLQKYVETLTAKLILSGSVRAERYHRHRRRKWRIDRKA